MRQSIALAVLSLSSAAFAAEPASKPAHHGGAMHHDAASGMSSGKASFQDMHFTSRKEAVATCPGGAALDRPDGSFACDMSSSTPSDMAINEKGMVGTKGTTKKDPK